MALKRHHGYKGIILLGKRLFLCSANVASELHIAMAVSWALQADASVLNDLPVLKHSNMAKNGKTGDGHRNGQVKDRSQVHNPKTDTWVKRDTDTGRFLDGKSDDKPFKGVRKEN